LITKQNKHIFLVFFLEKKQTRLKPDWGMSSDTNRYTILFSRKTKKTELEWANNPNLPEKQMSEVVMGTIFRRIDISLFFCENAERIKPGLDSDTFKKYATDYFAFHPNAEIMISAAQREWEIRKSSPDQPASAVIEKEKEEID